MFVVKMHWILNGLNGICIKQTPVITYKEDSNKVPTVDRQMCEILKFNI